MASFSSAESVHSYRIQPVITGKDDFAKEIQQLVGTLESQLDRVSEITWGEFKDYSRATSQDVSKTWGKTTKDMKGIATESLWGTVSAWFDDDMDQVEDIWDNAWNSMIGSADKAWDGFLNRAVSRAWSGLNDIFDKAVMEPATDWLSGALGLSDIGFDFNGKMEDFFAAVEMGDSYLDALDAAGILPISGAVEAVGSMFSGGGVPAAIAEGWGITAGVTDMGVVAGAEGATQASSLASMFTLASPLGAFGLALGPGLLGMGLSQVGFLMDGPMTPEEAKSNFFGDDNQIGGGPGGSLAVLEHWSQKLDELTDSMGTVNEQLGLFGDSTQEAWEDFERLGTVAGYTAEEMDAVYNSLDANTQMMLTSGEAANLLEDEVRQLAQEINASAGSMTLAGGGAREFNGRIGDLAGRLGLSGDAALEFQAAIYQLAEGFNLGGEEAGSFEAALQSFTQGTLASLTQGAEGSRQAIQALIESMKGVAGASESMKVEDLGDGTTRFTAIDYASGGAVDSLGLSSGGGGGIDDLGIGSFHRGGLVLGWPRAHAGALISSLAHDEVPIVARRGEYVVRAESVNAATLPALKALNQGAAAPAGDMAVNFTININGNVMGNDDQIEDMVRLIETRLRQLQSSRWGG